MTPTIRTLADLVDHLGGVPLDRIRFRPAPGTATLQDVIDAEERQDMLCELVEGVLVQKAPGFRESILGAFVGTLVYALVRTRNLGIVTGAGGAFELRPGLVRIPCIAFTDWDRMPGRRCPTAPIPRLAPNLVVEVLRRNNPPGEMAVKRRDYFGAGVELVWEIDPEDRSVVVYTPTGATTLGPTESLDGGTVLPGFALALRDLFAELDRTG